MAAEKIGRRKGRPNAGHVGQGKTIVAEIPWPRQFRSKENGRQPEMDGASKRRDMRYRLRGARPACVFFVCAVGS